ncbi:unnamed protein product [Phytophthora fragariaefolia]|uniref:Unnamed protein product n=1 Tax=Phytophthora fragariaefolia TaxID=1490495 RepID=A0A9W6XR66_9STRA|nr:unnamed protein product [Phytophthora fragariaefolia]
MSAVAGLGVSTPSGTRPSLSPGYMTAATMAPTTATTRAPTRHASVSTQRTEVTFNLGVPLGGNATVPTGSNPSLLELFSKGLGNKAIRAILRVSYVSTIPQACEYLLLKEMHRPEEEEDEFMEERSRSVNPALEDIGRRILPMQNLLLAQQQQMEQLQQRLSLLHSPRSCDAQIVSIADSVPSTVLRQCPQMSGIGGTLRGVLQGPGQRVNKKSTVASARLSGRDIERETESEKWKGSAAAAGAKPTKTVRFVEAVVEREKKGDGVLPMGKNTSGRPALGTVPGPANQSWVPGPVPGNDVIEGNVEHEMAEIAPVAVPTEEPTTEYRRLFTEAKLTAIEENQWPATDPETEEYDKELEDRLYPLDEVELKGRVEENALRSEELSLEELSAYQNTLASSQEAKRANRDFSNTVRNGDSVSACMSLEVPTAHDTERKDAHVDSVAGSSEGEVPSEPREPEDAAVIYNISVAKWFRKVSMSRDPLAHGARTAD